jgi:hypothetical protein
MALERLVKPKARRINPTTRQIIHLFCKDIRLIKRCPGAFLGMSGFISVVGIVDVYNKISTEPDKSSDNLHFI